MVFQQLNSIIFDKEVNIRAVLERFNQTAYYTESSGFGIVVDENKICIGVVTDGDIRRKLISGVDLDDPIVLAMNSKFLYAKETDSPHSVLRNFDKKILNLPVLNEHNQPVDLFRLSYFKASARGVDKIIRARVPVRITYSGGGTDMSYYINHFSAAVLSSTITKYVTASILVNLDSKIRIRSKDLGIEYEANSIDEIEFGDKLDLIKSAVKIMQPQFGFDLETHSDIDAGTGLGGSSALTVAVIGALNQFRNDKGLDFYDIADLAYQSERVNLGISGGWQDQYSTLFGGFNWIKFRKDEVVVSPLRLSRDILLELKYNLMLFRFGGTHDSGKIHKAATMFDPTDTQILSKYRRMTDLAIEMKEALLKGKIKNFGNLLDKSWELKKSFNQKISNQLVDDLYNIAKVEGALGGKLLGAGGAGYILIYSSPKFHKAIKDSFALKGAILEPFDYTDSGLEVWSTLR
jgi:D-glycero-alpha-D-manno-heptose-7-phosphate kinase